MTAHDKAEAILGHLNEDEPIFILRAQDILSVMAIRHYASLIENYCYHDTHQLESVVQAANEFAQWQRENPGKVKLPD